MERDNLIKLFCIVLLIILNGAVYFHGQNLSCDECKLKITHNFMEESVRLIDVYNHFINGTCLIERSGNNYIVHGYP